MVIASSQVRTAVKATLEHLTTGGRTGGRMRKRAPIMVCYPCAEQGFEQQAVALCRSCSGGLCLDHLRETASRFGSSHILDSCHHDTWVVKPPSGGGAPPRAGSRL